MKILQEKFDSVEKAKQFWDNSVFDMLDISFYLADCSLANQSKEFCSVFANQKYMNAITNYSFNFALIKKFLNVPSVYLNRNADINNLANVERVKPTVYNAKDLLQKFDDVMAVLYKEIEIVTK